MKKFIVFETKEACAQRCNELTEAYNNLGIEPPTIYAEPLEGEAGWYIPIIEYCKQIFSAEEINNSVDYKPLENEETIEL